MVKTHRPADKPAPAPRRGPMSCRLCVAMVDEGNQMNSIPGRSSAALSCFRLLDDRAPLVAGHQLVVSSRHVLSMGALWSNEAVDQLQTIIELFRTQHSRMSKRTLLLEHGPLRPGGGGACIDHAHLHVLPVAGHIELREILGHPVLARSGLSDWRQLRSVADLTLLSRHASYLWIGATNGLDYVTLVGPSASIPSQTLRRWSAEFLGVPNWDWRIAERRASEGGP